MSESHTKSAKNKARDKLLAVTGVAKTHISGNHEKYMLGFGVVIALGAIAYAMFYLKWKMPWEPATGATDLQKGLVWGGAGLGVALLVAGGFVMFNKRKSANATHQVDVAGEV